MMWTALVTIFQRYAPGQSCARHMEHVHNPALSTVARAPPAHACQTLCFAAGGVNEYNPVGCCSCKARDHHHVARFLPTRLGMCSSALLFGAALQLIDAVNACVTTANS